jgi:hypothetical protein
MARDVMILMRANRFRGPLAGVGNEDRDFFCIGPEMETCEASAIWVQKSRDFQGPPLLSNGFVPIKIMKSKRHIKKPGGGGSPSPNPYSPLYSTI